MRVYRIYAVFGVFFSTIVVCFAKRGFMLTTPKILDAGSTEYLTVTLKDVPNGGFLTLRLLKPFTGEVLADSKVLVHNNQNTWIQLQIPELKIRHATLLATGSFADGYKIHAKQEVGIRMKSVVIFIQTDKPLYKPGQTVQFRIMPMDSQLASLPEKTIGDIWIEDPSSIRVAQWKELDLSDGLVQLQLPLSEEPVLGTWTIKAEVANVTQDQMFKVQEYVLPKFEVIVSPPPYIMPNDPDIPVTICAKYSYGKKVDGVLHLKMTYQPFPHESEDKVFPSVVYFKQISGCAYFLVDSQELLLDNPEFAFRKIEIFAEITENGTGISQNASTSIAMTHLPLEMKFLGLEKGAYYFKPGLDYHGKLQVTKPDGEPAMAETIRICAKSRTRLFVTSQELDFCNLFLSNKDGIVEFVIPAQTKEAVQIILEAKSTIPEMRYDSGPVMVRQPQVRRIVLKSWFSPSGSYLQIEAISNDVACDRLEKVRIKYTTEHWSSIKFYHQVISRGRIVQLGSHSRSFYSDHNADQMRPPHEEVQLLKPKNARQPYSQSRTNTSHVGEFMFNFDARSTMSPVARLLVFYIRDDGEIVADSRTFRIQHCLRNQVKLLFRHQQQYPSTEAAMLLSASPSSLCGLGVVDKSVHLLHHEQKFSKSKVFELLESFDVGKETQPSQVTNKICGEDDLKRKKRSLAFPAQNNYVDAVTAFDDAGAFVITDLVIETAPCVTHFPLLQSRVVPAEINSFSAISLDTISMDTWSLGTKVEDNEIDLQSADDDANATPKTEEIRTYFPETWLWELHQVGANGEIAVKRKLPHTITEWVGEAVCVHPKQGLGISDFAQIAAFQPFFVSFNLPYSVIRGEEISVPISVFNYVDDCLQIRLSLERSNSYLVVNGTSNAVVCVCSERSETTHFVLKPLDVGSINITVYAYTVSEDGICRQKGAAKIKARDAVTRQLLVEPEGFPKEETFNHFICPQSENGSYAAEVDLLLPENVVKGSTRAYVSVTGDVMGPALNSLENLVQLPKGCGEQNMVLFAPILYVLEYLTKTGRVTDDVWQKSISYIQKGYQKELTYRHEDGSYSTFGPKYSESNMWLTAFVLKSFAKAEHFTDIDRKELSLTLGWIQTKQLENGCFMPLGSLLNKALQGGLRGSQSLAPLTAYILISLLETGINNQRSTIMALACLAADVNTDIYGLSLFAYASALADEDLLAFAHLEDLESNAIQKDGMMYWEHDSQSVAVNVEIASYYLLAKLEIHGSKKMVEIMPVVRWIVKQQNSNGGFVSTQDTVVALQALAKYSSFISSDELDIGIAIEGDDLTRGFKVDEANKLLMQTQKISVLPNVIDLQAAGKGCAIVQFSLKYNVENVTPSDSFDLNVEALRQGSLGCNNPAIGICMRYKIPQEVSNMVVLEVNMLSGYVVDKWNLHKIEEEYEIGLKRFEIKGSTVYFYFEELSNSQRCFRFMVKNEIEVTNGREAIVKLYDYYQPVLELRTSYSIPMFCSLVPLPDLPRLLPMIFLDPTTKELDAEDTIDESSISTPMNGITADTDSNLVELSTPPREATVLYITHSTTTETSEIPEQEVTSEGPGQGETSELLETTWMPEHATVELGTGTSEVTPGTGHTAVFLDDDMQQDSPLIDGFWNVEEELDFPEGIEGNQPVSVPPPENFEDRDCPICMKEFPSDFTYLYCSSSLALRASIKNIEKGAIKVTQNVSLCFAKPQQVKLFGNLLYDKSCTCNQLKQKGAVFILGHNKLLRESGQKLQLNLTSDVHVFASASKKALVAQIRKAKRSCSKDSVRNC